MRSLAAFQVMCFGLLCVVCFIPLNANARHRDTVADLTARIQQQNNPVKKAKLEVRLGRLEIEQAISAYDHRQIEQGQKLLSTSDAEMGDAWSLLKGTGRNAAKKPDGFIQLEMGLNESLRVLDALRQRTFYLYRGPIDEAVKTLTQMHSQVLVAIFPGAVTPPAAKPGKDKIPAYQQAPEAVHP